MNISYLASLANYIPELIIVLTMVVALFMEATYRIEEKGRLYVFISSVIGLVLAFAFLIASLSSPSSLVFTGAAVIDPFSSLMKMIMVLGTFGPIYLAYFSKEVPVEFKSEFVILVLGVLVGGMLLASANNFLTLYLGIETMSILSYVLAALNKDNELSSEAGVKYALYGAVSAGIMLFGMGHLYGQLGSIHFIEMAKAFSSLTPEQLYIVIPSLLMFFVGLGYKISSFPFHMWTPDVYEGSPISVTAFFAIVPKVAGLSALTRVTYAVIPLDSVVGKMWISFLMISACLTMTVGNISAINQKSIKRLLAFSSISHIGFLLMGLLVANEIGLQSLVFYSFVYVFMTLTVFFITSFISDQYGNDHIDRFNGLIHKHPFVAITMTVALFSLAGLPPFSGFIAKFNIFSALMTKKYYVLALIGALNSVIAMYYYMYVIKVMILKKPENNTKVEKFGFTNQLIIGLTTAPILIFGIFWETIYKVVQHAKIFIP